MQTLQGERVLAAQRRGSSRPLTIATTEGPFLVKLRGAAHGPAALVAEVLVAELAERLGLRVPRRALVVLDEHSHCADRDAELADLLAASQGANLGLQFLEGARDLRVAEVAEIPEGLACRVLWLDALVQNADRTARNPNLMMRAGQLWLIDHGAALPFQHHWPGVTESSPRRAYALATHVFGAWAPRLQDWDEGLASALTRDALLHAVERIPTAFLQALLPQSSDARALERRRQAYAAFLWKRLRAPRPFCAPASTPSQPASGAPCV
jgi:hypothetical protein